MRIEWLNYRIKNAGLRLSQRGPGKQRVDRDICRVFSSFYLQRMRTGVDVHLQSRTDGEGKLCCKRESRLLESGVSKFMSKDAQWPRAVVLCGIFSL